eukprot:7377205-Prymnesium_polylepis.1
MSALQAAKDFNDRSPAFIAEFGQLGACDKKLNVSLRDSGSTGTPSTTILFAELTSSRVPDVIIGPGRSTASMPTATLAGIMDIPQISYWATSKVLDSLSDYPRFMRTIPNDDAIAYSLCQLWRDDMSYTRAAMLFSNDPYGEAYKESVLDHCQKRGVTVSTFPYDASDLAAARQQVVALAATNLRVALWVGSQQALPTIMDEAYKQDLLTSDKGFAWIVTDGASPADVAAVPPGSDAPIDTHSGILRLLAAGGTADNARWGAFAAAFSSFDLTYHNAMMPGEWQVSTSWLSSFDALGNGYVRDVGTYEYDAVAAAGLIACQVAPTGALPATFGSDFWGAKTSVEFDGLSGR